jgi:TRAP-type C4-dicarboxylate transport system permease small subunit
MNNVEARLRAASQSLALLGFTGLLGLALMTSLDVFLRWLLGIPIQGVNDVSSVVMAVVVAACIPANLAMKQNISVEVLGSIGGGRFHRALDAFASSVTLAFIILIAWQFVPYTMNLRANGERTWVLGWPIWPWWFAVSAMMIFAAIIQLTVFVADLFRFVRGADAPLEPGDNPGLTDAHL